MIPPTRVHIVICVFLLGFLFLSFKPDLSVFPIKQKTNGSGALVNVNETSDAGLAEEWPTPGDRIIVMAKIKSEDADWVGENLPDWQSAIYHMDDRSWGLQVPANKGHEAMAYLTYMIEHYDSLPSIIAFLHSHRDGPSRAWHTDAEGFDNVKSILSLNLDYVQSQGYVNLRCQWNPGCPDEVQPFRQPRDQEKLQENAMAEAWAYLFPNQTHQIPETIAVACCAQFAVTRNQILERPRSDYERFRRWLLHTDLDDETSGRVMEYLWHILFGRDVIHCPAPVQCYCDVYGRC